MTEYELVSEVMHREAQTGNKVTVVMKSEFFNKMIESTVRYVRAEGVVAGIPFYLDDTIEMDYMLLT
jgi:hypothetical protein